MEREVTASPSPGQRLAEIYQEGLRLFMGQGTLNQTLSRLAADLDQHGIEYMIIGAVALIAHGYRRFTEDIDLVMTAEGLETFHRELTGRGYVPQFPGAKEKIRTADGVRIEIITSGEFPGDGKPKPVSFPRPNAASVQVGGIQIVTLEKLIELKLAFGMTAPDRLRDLADVQELIKIQGLDAGFAQKLDPYVRAKYLELWEAVRQAELTRDQQPEAGSRTDE